MPSFGPDRRDVDHPLGPPSSHHDCRGGHRRDRSGHVTLTSLARRVIALTAEVSDLDDQLTLLVTTAAPTLTATFGVGVEVAGQLLVTAGDNPDRIGSEAQFARLCGIAPIPASSGKDSRVGLN